MADSIEKLTGLQEVMKSMPQADVPSHFVQGGGVAAKTVFFQAGLTVMGGMHRFENMNIMHSGDIVIFTDDVPVRYTVVDSPVIVVSPPGTKRVAYVVKDTYWTSLHATDKTDVDEVQKEFIIEPCDEIAFTKMIGA